MLNQVTITGRITADLDVRRTQSQKAVASFCIACERDFAPEGGNKVSDFIDCIVWEKKAEAIAKWFAKGDPITVLGRLTSRNWEDKSGNKRKSIELLVSDFYFPLTNKNGKSEPVSREEQQFVELDDEGDLPF